MAIELDIEDILGAGCLACIGRGLATLSSLWLGAATGSLAYLVAEAGLEAIGGGRPDVLEWTRQAISSLAWGPLLILRGTLLPLFFPLVFAIYFMLGRGEGVTLRSWLVFTGLTGMLVLASMLTWGELSALGMALASFLWAGFAGSLVMLACLLVASQRRRFSEHLMVIAAENDERRRELNEEFGIATADSEFATGESRGWALPPEAQGTHPEVPPPPRRDG